MARKTYLTFIRVAISTAVAFFMFAAVGHASAATLYLSTRSATESTGQNFTVSVYASSPDQAMNAAHGVVSFPIGSLQVLSLSTAGSIMNLWVQQPSYSNQDGVVNFEGVAVNPGFQGSAGKILTITFAARQAGTAAISFTSGAVLANDGKGTNILTAMQGTTITLAQAAPGTTVPQTTIANPFAPLIISVPSVNDGTWYNLNSIQFNWNVPADAVGVEYALATSTDPSSLATVPGTPAVASFDLTQIPDGRWYFLLKIDRPAGSTPVAIKQIFLDRSPPEPFTITRVDKDLTDAQPVFAWSTSDNLSGIAYYLMKIGGGDWFDPSTIQHGSSYILPPQAPQKNSILSVRAYDNAGNVQQAALLFTVNISNNFSSDAVKFFAAWEWAFILLGALLVVGAYLLIYHLAMARRRLRRELVEFKAELTHDLARIEREIGMTNEKGDVDLRPAHLSAAKRSLEKEVKHLEEEVREEIKKVK